MELGRELNWLIFFGNNLLYRIKYNRLMIKCDICNNDFNVENALN